MPADDRSHIQSLPLPRSRAGRALAGAILTASLSMGAALWASTDSAGAMSFRGGGFGGFQAGNGSFRGSAFRLPASRSRVGVLDARSNGAARRLGARVARQPPPRDGETGPPHPRRPHPPVIVGFPGGPAGPSAIINMPLSGPSGPPANE